MKTTLHRPWRKALSLMLTVLMVGGYVGMFSGLIGRDLFGTRQTADAVAVELTNVVIGVPETVYMTPQNNYGTATTSVKYYVNNTVSSSGGYSLDATNGATAGKFYVYSPQISSIDSISVDGASLSNLSATKSGSLFSDTSFTMSLSSGISSSQTKLLEWTIRVTDTNGGKHALHAYTVAYAPYLSPVFAAGRCKNTRGSNSFGSGLSWVSGIHGISTGGGYYPYNNFLPIVDSSHPAQGGGTSNPDGWFNGGQQCGLPTAGGWYTSKEYGYNYGDETLCVFERSAESYINVDTSRYTNLNQIPNLNGGIYVTDNEGAGTVWGYWGKLNNWGDRIQSGRNWYTRKTTNPSEYDASVDIYSGDRWTNRGRNWAIRGCAMNSSIPSGWVAFRGAFGTDGSGDRCFCILDSYVNFIQVNKASLRNLIKDCYKYTSTYYPGETYDNFISAMRTAASVLGNPASTDVTNAYNTLNSAKNALKKAVTLSLNTAVTVNHTDSYSLYYLFTPSENGKYVFFTYDTDNTPDPYLYLHNFDISVMNGLSSSSFKSNDDIGDAKIRELLSGSQSNMGSYQSYIKDAELTAGVTYIVKAYDRGNVGSYPMKVCKAVDITFNATGGATTFTKTLPAGHTLHMDQSGLTRDGHTLIAWSTSGSGSESKSCMASDTITIPSSNTTYYALWNPSNAPILAVNSDYTATISAGAEIAFYQFTPSTSHKYLIYGLSSTDTYGLLYNANTYASNGSYQTTNDDGGQSAFGQSSNQFFLKQSLTAGTKYLYGVKYYNSTATGSIPFRFEEVYDVTYNNNGGSGAPAAQEKYYNKDLTLQAGTPTRSGYAFDGWGTSAADKTVDYNPSAVYTANADLSLYAIWSRPITNTYRYYDASLAAKTVTKSKTAYNAETSINIDTPASSEVAVEIEKNDKTWTLKGWSANTVASETWGGATQTAPVGIGGSTAVNVSAATANTYYPVYALKSTTFYANFKYLADEATAYTDKKMSGTAIGDDTTGAMTVAPVTEDGANGSVPRYYTKDGVVWELQGWSQTESALGTGTATIAYNDATVTLNVPGAGNPTSTLNQTEIASLYPVYKKYATAIHAHFNYYTAAGESTFLDVSGRAVGETATAGDVKYPDASLVNTSYEKDGVTYTLVGWSDVNNSDAYSPFNTTASLAVLANPATDYYTFYPVYECTTTVRYYTYTSAGAQTSLTRSTALLKTDSFTPATADVAIPQTGFNKVITLNGRTFTFCGWRADATTDAAPTVASDVNSGSHAVRDAEYTYYAIYTNDALALRYETAHDGVTAAPAPATQNKSQYISVATGSADINNVAEITFDINPDNVVPEKTGYTFIGWGDEDSEAETADYAKTGATLRTRVDKSLFARFSVNSQNVTFIYYDGADLKGDYKRLTKQVSYDDLLRDDTDSNPRYVVTAPTVKLVVKDAQGNPVVNLDSIVHANDKYHYVFKEWVRSDAAADKDIHTVAVNGNAYTATFKHVQEDITVQAMYDAYAHHYEQLTTAQLAENGVTADTTAFKDATCTTDGYQYMKCVDCGHVYKQIIPKIGHKDANGNPVVTYSGYKASTCTATGKYATAACALCGDTVRTEDNTSVQYYDIQDGLFVPVDSADGVIPAKGHNYQFGSTVAPTCTEKGYDLYVCANNETHTEKRNLTDALGHDPETQAGTPATCTAEGRADKTVCRRCGLIISDSYVIPALGHEMERTAAKDSTCTESGNIAYYTCRNCEKIFADKDGVTEITLAGTVTEALGHDWVETAAEEATCTRDGHTAGTVCSRCGEIAEGSAAVTTQEALGHDWDEGVHTDSDKPCVNPGYTTYTCRRCEETEVVYDELADHVEKTVAEQPATCTEKGKSSYKICDVCGKVLTNYKWLPMKAHTYTETVTAEAPATCTAPGTSAVMKCANCDATVGGDEIPALDHSYSNWIVTAASCEEDGVRTKYCKRCGHTVSEAIPAAGHTEKTVEAVPATCSAEGKTAGTVCEVCGQVLEGCEVIPMTAHEMGEAQIEREATCAQAGLEYTECAVCGYKEYTTIEKPAHTETVTKEAVAATCTATGLKAEITCSVCGTVLQAQTSVPKLDHVWQTMPAVAPTCTEKGKTSYEKCVNCGLLLTESRDVPALGHQWGEWQLVKAATCLEDGSRVRYCTVETCEAHTAVVFAAQTKVLDKLGHNMTRVAAKAPTCGVAGNPEYYVCSRCADVYYADAAGAEKYTAEEIVLPALSHNWGVTSVTDPTCTEAGFTTVTCANCGETKRTDELPANGHRGGTATCLEKAVCEVCGEAYGGLADHQYVTVVDEGDCQHNGVSVKTCSVCGDEVTTELPLGPHQPEYVVVTAPTCTENGASQWVCTVCGEVIEEGTLEAMGHHDDNGDGKCDKCGQSMNGSTEDSGNGTTTGVCDKCGRNHVGKTGGFWGYDGFVCKLISFFRSIVRLFSK